MAFTNYELAFVFACKGVALSEKHLKPQKFAKTVLVWRLFTLLCQSFFPNSNQNYYFFFSSPLRIKVKHNHRNFSFALTKVTSKFFVPSFCFTSDHEESPGTISWNNVSSAEKTVFGWIFAHYKSILFCPGPNFNEIEFFSTSPGTFAIKTNSSSSCIQVYG